MLAHLKSIPETREREANEKSIPIIRERESEAFIPGNGRERDFQLTPATSLVHNHFEDYLVSILTPLCYCMTCQRIVDRIVMHFLANCLLHLLW